MGVKRVGACRGPVQGRLGQVGQHSGSPEPGEDCGITETRRSCPHSSLLRVLRAPFPRAGMQIQLLKQPGKEQIPIAGKQGPCTPLRLAVPVGTEQQQGG